MSGLDQSLARIRTLFFQFSKVPVVVARRAYCVGEVPENHVCPFVRVSVCLSVCPSGPFLIQFLSSKLKILVLFLSKGGPKKGPSGTFGSKSEIDLG